MASKSVHNAVKKGPPPRTYAWLESNQHYAGDDCLIWPFYRCKQGVAKIVSNGWRTTAARAMCSLAHGEAPFAGAYSVHSCGNGHLGCVNPRHLRWATPAENSADSKLHGTFALGEKNGLAKLDRDKVIAIRADSRSLRAIARDYAVAYTTVEAIKSRRSWAHVD